jgi:translation elongation factor EF-Tu-like GTPase
MAATVRGNIRMLRFRHACSLLFLCAAFAAGPALADGADIVLLGDKARIAMFKLCNSPCEMGGFKVETVGADPAASEVANALKSAKHAIVVVDATVGPLPVTREHIQIARQAGVPSLSILFAHVAGLNGKGDPNELLEIEELEVRELMNLYQMHGDTAMVFHDAEPKPLLTLHTNGMGIGAALVKAALLPPRPAVGTHVFTAAAIAARVYLLTPAESPQAAPLAEKASVALWVNGKLLKGATLGKGKLVPGENVDVVFALPEKITVAPGARFFLEQNRKLVAMGVVTGAAE